jgi:hypothetical protein
VRREKGAGTRKQEAGSRGETNEQSTMNYEQITNN